MFDLETAIAAWRRSLELHRVFLDEDVEELEAHVREQVAALVEDGLSEEAAFQRTIREMGPYHAAEAEYRKVYWGKLRRRRMLRNELTWRLAMLKNYLKIALRHLRRHKGYTALNVAGLATGIACCLLLLLFVRDELRYDRYHERAGRIFRLVKGNSANSPERWAPALEMEFPEVAHAVRLMGNFSRALATHGDQRYPAPGGLYADAAVFEVFSWPLLHGDPQTALAAPFSVVLTAPMAEQLFGNADPIGRVLTIGGIANDARQRDYTVTGVMAPVPRRSHVQFDYLISMQTVESLDEAGEWGTPLSWTNRMAKTYLLLHPQGDPRHLEARLPAFLRRYIDDEQYSLTDARLQPLTDIHLYSDLHAEFQPGGNIAYVYLLAALAGFILLIACINFTNLATARSQQRAREVGMRKALGARRVQLAGQFLGESILLSLLALGLAVLLLEALQPAFSSLTGKTLGFNYLDDWPVALGFLGIALAVGLLAGSYPALVLSAFRPVQVLKTQAAQGRSSARFRQILVVFQFTLSTILLISTAVIYDQLHYLRNADLGFEEEQVVVLPIGHSTALRTRADVVKRELSRHPNVTAVSASHSIPSQFLNGFYYLREGAAREERITLGDVSVDHEFIEIYEMELLAGRSFSRDLAADSTAFVLNASAARALGWTRPEDAVGQQITWDFPMGFQGPVIGVVRDFHFGSLHDAIPPIVFHISRFGSNFISARVRPAEMATTLAFLERSWRRFEPAYPFEYFFLDEEYARLYEAEERLGRTFSLFAGLAVLIACLGLLGLAAFAAEQRTKEIGVRKVLGASMPQIVLLLSKDFTRLVLLAFVVAAPVAYLVMQGWLRDFAYRVEISWPIFLMAGLAALGVAWLTVGYHSVKAALANPAHSLRYE